MSSIGGEPGSWIFDGTMPGWAGFIATPGPLRVISVNSGTGHFYATGKSGPLLIVDGRDTPAPQGSVYPFGADGTFILTDAGSRRFFIHHQDDKDATRSGWLVLEDNTPSAPPQAPPDYDALTDGVEEGRGTAVTFSNGVRGYGSRLHWVGGYGGLVPTELGAQGFGTNDANFGPQTRSVMVARVGSSDLRGAGSSASAQAVAPDAGTGEEWEARRNTIRSYCGTSAQRLGADPGQCGGGPDAVFETAADNVPAWPWRPVTCLDGAGEPVGDREESSGGTAEVRCSRGDERTVAETSFDSVRYRPDVGASSATGLEVSIGFSSFSSDSRRTKDEGGTSTATAVARNVRVAAAGAEVSIAEAAATAAVAAHGRPKSAAATWHRGMSGVVVRTAGGQPQRLADCQDDGCAETLLQINRTIGEAIQLHMPEAERVATPKGAYAGIRKTDADYYTSLVTQEDDTRSVPAFEIVGYSDRQEKSRVLVQLAAIEATSIYTVSKGAPQAELFAPPVLPPAGSPVGPVTALPSVPGMAFDAPAVPLGSSPPLTPAQAVRDVLAFLARSPLEALQLGAVLSLFTAATVAVRRRSFVKHLVNGAKG